MTRQIGLPAARARKARRPQAAARLVAAGGLAALLAACASAPVAETAVASVQPQVAPVPAPVAPAAPVPVSLAHARSVSPDDPAFDAWVQGVKAEARGKGISQGILDAAFRDVKPIPRVIELDRSQPESTITFEQYMTRVVPQRRVDQGRRMMAEFQSDLADVEARFGVPAEVVVALWGVETDFGRVTGNYPVIASLATLAYEGRRAKFFRGELMHALKILDEGHISPDQMRGSWAGAMGQSQFMPSSFVSYAIDGDGDGRKDIWGTRKDVFASAANYLASRGWERGFGWGGPVDLPAGFDRSRIGLKGETRTVAQWAAAGVTGKDGAPLPAPANVSARIVLPGKQNGPAFLATDNYEVILRWNRSQYFATAVGTLADRIAGR